MKTAILYITILFSLACNTKNEIKTGYEGSPLPSISLLLPDSTSWVKTEDINPGRPFIVFLFGPHCTYSKAQMADIIKENTKLKNTRIILITPYPFNDMKHFQKEYELSKYSNIQVGYDSSNVFGAFLGVKGVPFIAIYDKNKKLATAFEGKTKINDIVEVLKN